MSKFEEVGKGIVRRRERRFLGLFIDGTGLDRAARRLNKKVDLAALVKGVSSGINATVARYYTIIPYEDDSRQHAFLDAVSRAGLSVIVKRLPPKGVTRQVSVDVEMAADIIAFGLGHSRFSALSEYVPIDNTAQPESKHSVPILPGPRGSPKGAIPETKPDLAEKQENARAKLEAPPTPEGVPEVRAVTVVCPSRDLAYPISLVKELGVDTTNADFGKFSGGDVLKAAAKWIDLSDSETIWRD